MPRLMILKGLSCMTVGTSHNTLFDLPFRLREALGITNIQRFGAFDMIKMQSGRMPTKAAITTTGSNLVIVEPTSKSGSAFITNAKGKESYD